ncbi:MAG TPA: hypothetical protein VL135_00250 [Terracidiphilus sp.]|nr:hypothetical protein [Terracidiphilus sp.]
MPIEAPLKARFNNRHAGGGHLGVRLRPRRLSGISCFRSGNLPLLGTGYAARAYQYGAARSKPPADYCC